MSDDETRYFLFRAEEELRAARAASHPDAAKAHYVLAGYYLDLAHNPASRRARPAAPPPEVTGQAAFA